jgi:Domain of unknown function (DUF1707)
VSEEHQVVQGTRASHRQRRETKNTIKRAFREGRLSQAICDARMQAASQAVITTELTRLTRDLGEPEGTHPVHIMAALLGAVTVIAAWEPVFLLSAAWLVMAAPVTVITAYASWQLPNLLA